VCAERAALSRAARLGARPGDVEAIAITASPCGGCRQWMLEFKIDRVVFLHDGETLTRTPDELLPDSFSL
jgi:cytidine deaminase